MELRQMLTNKRREYTRIRALPEDVRVQAVRAAFRQCETTMRCRSREHIRDSDYKDIERLVGLIDDLQVHGATTEGLLGIGHALTMAVEMTVYVGTGAPKESACESFATESVVEGHTNAAVALALDTPKSPGRMRGAIAEINRHISALVRQRLVFLRDWRQVEGSVR